MSRSFDSLLGVPCAFYGVDNHQFRLQPRGGPLCTFEAVEEEIDSSRTDIRDIRTVPAAEAGIFFATPVATVIPTAVDNTAEGGDFSGYVFTDVRTGHVWLRAGTYYTEDHCYTSFLFDYTPSGEQHPVCAEPPPGTLCS